MADAVADARRRAAREFQPRDDDAREEDPRTDARTSARRLQKETRHQEGDGQEGRHQARASSPDNAAAEAEIAFIVRAESGSSSWASPAHVASPHGPWGRRPDVVCCGKDGWWARQDSNL